LHPINILTGGIAVEVTGVVGVSPALWYFRSSEHIFDSTQAPVITPNLAVFVNKINNLATHSCKKKFWPLLHRKSKK
jgi:hypothetical protein